MKRPATILSMCAPALLLSGCGWIGGGAESDTQMKNVEILPGTASDEMITLDQASGDGTAIDSNGAIGPAAPGAPSDAAAPSETADGAEKAPADAGEDGPSNGSEGGATARDGDAVIRPPGGRAEPGN